MRILFVIPYFYPAEAFGGPVKVAFDVGRELVKRGHDVVVYTSDACNRENRLNIKSAEVEEMKVYYFRNISMWFVKESNLFITPELSKKMKSDLKSFDVVHAHEYTTYQNIIVHRFAKKYGVPYVLQAHGSLPKIGRRARKWIYDLFFGSYLLRDASRVIALSSMEAKQYGAAGVSAGKIAIIPNGIDLSQYCDLPPKGAFKKKFGLSEKGKIVLYLGRINKIKGVDILVRAFADIAANLNDTTLVLVGPDDGYLGELKALIKALRMDSNVLLTGPLYGENKLQAYVDSDVYVLPSRYETFPMGLLEACACGKPVVASMVGGLSDLIADGVTGLLVPPEDFHQLACSIRSLLDDTVTAESIGLRGRESVKHNFAIARVADLLQSLYAEVVYGRSPNIA